MLVTLAGRDSAVEDPHDVGVRDTGCGARLGEPALGRPRILAAGSGPVLEHLHGDGLLRVNVTPTEHGREGPRSEHRKQLVAIQTTGERRRHRPGWYTQIVTAFPCNVASAIR